MRHERVAREHDYDGSDARRHVTVTLTLDGVPTRFEFAEEWLRTVSTERLTETTVEAFGNAYEALEAAAREIGSRAGEKAPNG